MGTCGGPMTDASFTYFINFYIHLSKKHDERGKERRESKQETKDQPKLPSCLECKQQYDCLSNFSKLFPPKPQSLIVIQLSSKDYNPQVTLSLPFSEWSC